MNPITTEEIKDRLSIEQVGRVLFPAWVSGKSCKSPFRQDRTPSFSVFDNSRAWKDHATGDSGDVISFYEKATGFSFQESLKRLSVMAGVYPDNPQRKPEPKKKVRFPADLHEGTTEELNTVAKVRKINLVACQLASKRGLLKFGTVCGFPCWIVTDQTRKSAQARRMDGEPFPSNGSLSMRKAHTLRGSSQSWPLGLTEAAQKPFLVIVEGAPDLLAALHFAQKESRADSVGVVAILGAANSVPEDALKHFANKRVRIFPHDDEPGMKAAKVWEAQLRAIGAETDCFRVGGVKMNNGGTSSDLNDLSDMDVSAAA